MKRAVKAARHRVGMTLKELSRKSGVSQGTISNWEGGTGFTTMLNVAAVCTVLGISIEEYIGMPPPAYKFIPAEEDLRKLRQNLTEITTLLIKWEKEIEEEKRR